MYSKHLKPSDFKTIFIRDLRHYSLYFNILFYIIINNITWYFEIHKHLLLDLTVVKDMQNQKSVNILKAQAWNMKKRRQKEREK